MKRRDEAWRSVVGLTAAGACALLVGQAAAPIGRTLAAAGTMPASAGALADLVGALVVAMGAVVAAWFAISGLLVAACGLSRWAGQPWLRTELLTRRWGAPVLRRLVGTAAGVALGAGIVVGPAAAVPGGPPDDLGWRPTTAAPADAGVGGSLPAGPSTSSTPPAPPASEPPPASPSPRATATPAAPSQAAPSPAAPSQADASTADTTTPGDQARPAPSAAHVVRPGDSLWRVAAARLAERGERATDAATAAEWPRWFAANRDVIGADPHLLRPGQVLQPPTGS